MIDTEYNPASQDNPSSDMTQQLYFGESNNPSPFSYTVFLGIYIYTRKVVTSPISIIQGSQTLPLWGKAPCRVLNSPNNVARFSSAPMSATTRSCRIIMSCHSLPHSKTNLTNSSFPINNRVIPCAYPLPRAECGRRLSTYHFFSQILSSIYRVLIAWLHHHPHRAVPAPV